MKNILLLLSLLLLITITSCSDNSKNKYITICEEYVDNYQNYLLHKYDNKFYTYVSDITPPPDWIKVKIYYPEMYEEYIAPVKHLWDSISTIPINIIEFQGLSDEMIRSKLRIKEIESIRGKMKKSDNSILSVGNDYYYQRDSIK